METLHWFTDPITKHYADFKGRATREQFWLFLLYGLLGIIIVWFLLVCFFAIFLNFGFHGATFWLGVIGVPLTFWSLIIPIVSIQVRRLHDIGWSGWWYFISFVPFGNLALLVLYCLPSQPGVNKYGPNPYGEGVEWVDVPVDPSTGAPIMHAAPEQAAPVVAEEGK